MGNVSSEPRPRGEGGYRVALRKSRQGALRGSGQAGATNAFVQIRGRARW